MGVCRVNERSSRREWVDRRAWKAEAFSKVHTPTGGVCGGLANCHSAVKGGELIANDATIYMLPHASAISASGSKAKRVF